MKKLEKRWAEGATYEKMLLLKKEKLQRVT